MRQKKLQAKEGFTIPEDEVAGRKFYLLFLQFMLVQPRARINLQKVLNC